MIRDIVYFDFESWNCLGMNDIGSCDLYVDGFVYWNNNIEIGCQQVWLRIIESICFQFFFFEYYCCEFFIVKFIWIGIVLILLIVSGFDCDVGIFGDLFYILQQIEGE